MSQVPATSADENGLAAYRVGWQATKELLRQGRSFSGYERNCVFLNCRGLPFANVSAITGLDFEDDGRAIGVTDWDHDGDLDLWLRNRTGPRLRFMRNETIRTDGQHDSFFVTIALRGTKSNRDAIGARVVVTLDENSLGADAGNQALVSPTTLVQTLQAGDAYLSQSSKRLHFGLGKSASLRQVSVRWPTGTVETFTDVEPGDRYELVEGSGRGIRLPSRPPTVSLVPRPQTTPPSSPPRRTYFANRVPLPLLQYRSLGAEENLTVDVSGQPLLLVLWASWCEPCVRELALLTQHAESLREGKVRVLALTVDGLDESHNSTLEDANAMLDRLGFPHERGAATVELLRKLELVQRVLFSQDQPIAVPTSFLFDQDGELAVVYRGLLDTEQLARDIAALDLFLEQRRDMAVPLAGRWLNPPRQLLTRAVGRIFEQHGFDEDHARYLQMDTEVLNRRRELAGSESERTEINRQFAAANYNTGLALVSSGDVDEAVGHFRRAVEVQPDHTEALINLGTLLARGGEIEDAILHFERALDVDAKSLPARMNLAAALAARRRFADAVKQYAAVILAYPDEARAHSQLGRMYLQLGKLKLGAHYLSLAARLDPQDTAAITSLAWLLATSTIDELRDGERALELSLQLRANSKSLNLIALDVLAAAHAEQGNYAAAIATLDQALPGLAEDLPARKILMSRYTEYTAGRPYRDQDGKYP